MGALLLAVHHIKLGNERMAAGFFSFVASQTLVISGSAIDLAASCPAFGADAGLWATGLAMFSVTWSVPWSHGWRQIRQDDQLSGGAMPSQFNSRDTSANSGDDHSDDHYICGIGTTGRLFAAGFTACGSPSKH